MGKAAGGRDETRAARPQLPREEPVLQPDRLLPDGHPRQGHGAPQGGELSPVLRGPPAPRSEDEAGHVEGTGLQG